MDQMDRVEQGCMSNKQTEFVEENQEALCRYRYSVWRISEGLMD